MPSRTRATRQTHKTDVSIMETVTHRLPYPKAAVGSGGRVLGSPSFKNRPGMNISGLGYTSGSCRIALDDIDKFSDYRTLKELELDNFTKR